MKGKEKGKEEKRKGKGKEKEEKRRDRSPSDFPMSYGICQPLSASLAHHQYFVSALTVMASPL
jgi:hypothetical protein